MGKFNYLKNLSLCAALYRCYKHTQLVFKSSPPPREPGEDNYSAVSILTTYLILSTADFGALLVFLNASLCSCTFSFLSVVRNLWKPRAIVFFLHQGCHIPSSLDEGNLCYPSWGCLSWFCVCTMPYTVLHELDMQALLAQRP